MIVNRVAQALIWLQARALTQLQSLFALVASPPQRSFGRGGVAVVLPPHYA